MPGAWLRREWLGGHGLRWWRARVGQGVLLGRSSRLEGRGPDVFGGGGTDGEGGGGLVGVGPGKQGRDREGPARGVSGV